VRTKQHGHRTTLQLTKKKAANKKIEQKNNNKKPEYP